MKTCILKVLTVLGLCLLTLNSGSAIIVDTSTPEQKESAARMYMEHIEETARYARLDSFGIDSRTYLYEIGKMESGNNYNVRNRYGMLGKYQFSIRTVKGLIRAGYLDLNQDEVNNFLHIPSAQERAMDALIKANNDYLGRYNMNRYVGKRIGGVKITKEGLLAASHLVGAYAVVHYCKTGGSLESVVLKSGVVVKKYDGNGVYLTEYMKKFSQVNV